MILQCETVLISICLLFALVAAVPAYGPPITTLQQLDGNLTTINTLNYSTIEDALVFAEAYTSLLSRIVRQPSPTSISQVINTTADIYAADPNTQNDALRLDLLGLNPYSHGQIISGLDSGINEARNINPNSPSLIYPKLDDGDAPYNISERELRGAIYIPPLFSFGRSAKSPVILVPGTGAPGGVTYAPNFAKLLSQTPFVEPVWLNIAGNTLRDIQKNAQFVAYAINYISSISSSKNVSVITWSQGSLDTQWALKYYPSTRKKVSDFIAVSPDFHGTLGATIACTARPCDPSVLQQSSSSKFIQTLLSEDGNSAYVPTTTIYSSSDSIVIPQLGTSASGYIQDARNVGVSNTEIQLVCAGKAAGGPFSHEGVLFNPVTYALAVDALTHSGPGQVSRLNLTAICDQFAAPGLTTYDVLATEGGLIVFATVNTVVYRQKTLTEPDILPFAAS
jgi:hypothetical protein